MTDDDKGMPGEVFVYFDRLGRKVICGENDPVAPESIKYIREDLAKGRGVEEITVKQLSSHIQTWRFDDQHDGPFGKFLMGKYPNGIRIVADKAGGGDGT